MLTGAIAEPPPRSFSFGPFVLIPERQLLTAHGAPAAVGGRALDLLVALVERCGELVSKRDLMASAWPDTFVDESNLKVNIAALRKVLGEPADDACYIATVTGRGYRFVAPVRAAGPDRIIAPLPGGSSADRSGVVGRTVEIDALCADLEAARLVSIVGPGGVGKSTVALAVAEQVARDGVEVCIADLAPLAEARGVAHTIAAAVGLPSPLQDVLEDVCQGLRVRRMVLVIDGYEHVTEAAATCADRILAVAPSVTILAAGREPLQLRSERVRRLEPLDVPPASEMDSAARALAFPAVQLFVDCARRRRRAFEVNDANAAVVGELCRRLDGLPLAIEWAAAWVEAFADDDLLDLLAYPFELLKGPRTGPERHQTLAAVLDWSFDLLSEDERATLARLAIFDGAFGLEAACRVIGGDCDRTMAVEHLANLVAKSLVVAERRAGKSEYRLLETTRAYARKRLIEAEEHRRRCERIVEAPERRDVAPSRRFARLAEPERPPPQPRGSFAGGGSAISRQDRVTAEPGVRV
jgi:predicted ATPase/DNA-binding winged helix-turn-helix (wHTH) protein